MNEYSYFPFIKIDLTLDPCISFIYNHDFKEYWRTKSIIQIIQNHIFILSVKIIDKSITDFNYLKKCTLILFVIWNVLMWFAFNPFYFYSFIVILKTFYHCFLSFCEYVSIFCECFACCASKIQNEYRNERSVIRNFRFFSAQGNF